MLRKSILQSLCDLEVTLLTGEVSLAEQLANSLPAQEQVSTICHTLIDHISEIDHSYSSVLPALRTLTLLMDHDYGFNHIKSALSRNQRAFMNLFMRINSSFSKDSSDCIATLSSAAECVQYMCTLPETAVGDGEEPLVPSGDRTAIMSISEMRTALAWSDDQGHPLDELEKLLQEYSKDEEALKALHETVLAITVMLRSEDEEEPEKDEAGTAGPAAATTGTKVDTAADPPLPPPEPLINQFAMRATYTISDIEDDRLTTAYWLALPAGDESDQELDLVRCDFEEMSEQYCPEFDLKSELIKDDKDTEPTPAKPRKRMQRARRNHDTINTSRMRGTGNRFIAPMRGRGFGRGAANNNRHDPFRSRPPNTSRPPSMHVDDFIKMENQHHGPSGSQPGPGPGQGQGGGRRQDKENNIQLGGGGGGGGGRGRGGFDRGGRGGGGGFGNRGRFFSPPGNYGNRRDMNERGGAGRGGYNQQGQGSGSGGPRGRNSGRGQRGGQGAMGQSRGGGMSKGNQGMKGQSPWPRARQFGQAASRGFGGRGGHDRSMSGDRRSSGEGRFGQRGRGRGGAGRGGRDRDMDTRFMPPPMGGFGGRGGDRRRHQRSFTK